MFYFFSESNNLNKWTLVLFALYFVTKTKLYEHIVISKNIHLIFLLWNDYVFFFLFLFLFHSWFLFSSVCHGRDFCFQRKIWFHVQRYGIQTSEGNYFGQNNTELNRYRQHYMPNSIENFQTLFFFLQFNGDCIDFFFNGVLFTLKFKMNKFLFLDYLRCCSSHSFSLWALVRSAHLNKSLLLRTIYLSHTSIVHN